MRVFIIPSWYPSEAHPSTGIFFREQAEILAKHRPDWQVGICLWGSHEPKLWVRLTKPLDALLRRYSKLPLKKKDSLLESNCVEFFNPALTWTRKLAGGNIKGIIKACEGNFERYTQYFGKPEVIHAHVAHPGGYIAMHLSKKYDVPYLVTEHMSPFPMESYQSDFKKWLLPPLRKANKVLAVSGALVNTLKHLDISADVTSNFIDDSYFQPIGKSENTLFTFVAIGRLERQKNYDLMLESCSHLKKMNPSFRLQIIGSGSEQNRLMKLADRLGLAEQVSWLGECSRAEILSALQSSAAFISTSLHENQPVAILEAMACGLPVLSTRWSGSDGFITDKMGRILDFNAAEISSAMNDWMTKIPFTSDSVRSAFLEKYGAEVQVAQIEKFYAEITNV